MERTRRWRIAAWVLAVLVAFALGVLLTRCLSPANTVGVGESPDNGAERGQSFAISGDLSEPVSPGDLVPLDLRFSNPHDDRLVISGVVVSVESVDAPRATPSLPCTVDDFTVEQLDTTVGLRLDPNDTRTLTQFGVSESDWPRVGMIDAAVNQDGCKGATLELGYTATGRFDS